MTLTLDHKSWSQWLHPKNSSHPTVYLSSDTLRSSTEYIVAPEFDASVKPDPAHQDDGLISSVDLTPIEELSSPSASSSGGHGCYSPMHPHLSNLDHVSSTIAFRTAAESHSIPKLLDSPSRPDARHSFHVSHTPSSSRVPSHSSVVASTSALTGPPERRPRNKLRKPPPTRNTVQRLSFIAEPFSEPLYDPTAADRISQSPPNTTNGYIEEPRTAQSALALHVHSEGHILFDPPPIPPPSHKRTGLFRRATSSNISTTTTQKLTKRRPSLPTQNTTPALGHDMSSRGKHSLLGRANSGPSSNSSLLHYTSASTPQLAPGTGERSRVLDRTSSDPVPFHPNIPSVKRNSTLGFSLRRKKKNDPVQTTSSVNNAEQGSEARRSDKISTFWSSGNHSRRSVSESGHGPPTERREWLPRVAASSPFQVTIHDHLGNPVGQTHHHGPTYESLSSDPVDPIASLAWTGVCPPDISIAPTLMLPQQGQEGWASTLRQGANLTSAPPTRAKFTLGPEREDGEYSGVGVGARPVIARRETVDAPRRRWTLAMAMTDEGITDEVLVEELERMRNMIGRNVDVFEDVDEDDDVRAWGEDNWHGDGSEGGEENVDVYGGPKLNLEISSTTGRRLPSTTSLPPYLRSPSPTWQIARRALLTCRELVRTERHYLASLQVLLSCKTATRPPALMLRYAGELVQVSGRLLGRMEEDPSAWGVAVALLGEEDGVESAFVAWCGVVGGWFIDGRDKSTVSSPTLKRKSAKLDREVPAVVVAADRSAAVSEASTPSGSPGSGPGSGSKSNSGSLKRTVNTWRKSMPSIPALTVTIPPVPSMPSPSPASASASTGSFLTRKRESLKSNKGKPTVRDLAILPTQRVMRYVLLYRDLLAHTPSTSPSRALVERAVEAACRIAQKCDRAQGNAAFLQRR